MKRVSSAPGSLNSMDRPAPVPAAASKLSSAAPQVLHLPANTTLRTSGAPPSRGDRLKPHALMLDVAPPLPAPPPPAAAATAAATATRTTDADFLYAVASEGVVTATACMPAIEMDEAPALVGSTRAEAAKADYDAASCMATPVMPTDRTNAELVHRRAARLGSEAEAQLRVRYAAEVGYASRPVSAPRLRRSGSRKRSLDDLDARLLMGGGHEGDDLGASAVGEAGGGARPLSPETKRLLAAHGGGGGGALEDPANKLHLDDHPELPKPDASISLEEPDHEWLVGSVASLDSMDSGAPVAGVPGQGGLANVVPFRRTAALALPAK